MKRILLTLITTLMVCSFVRGEELKWHSWNEGYALAKKENKPMLIFVQAPWCNTCKRLDEKTFNNDEVIPVINEYYIPVKLDAEAKDAQYKMGEETLSTGKLLQSISIDVSKGLGIPTTVIWNQETKKAKVIAGLLDPKEMKKELKQNRK